MDLKRKLSDFVKLEEAQSNLPRMAGLGVAVASSVLVGALIPGLASAATPHCDCHVDSVGHSDDEMHIDRWMMDCDSGWCIPSSHMNYSEHDDSAPHSDSYRST